MRIDGQAVESHRDLRDHIRSRDAGDSVELTVIRRGSERSVKATLGESERGDALLELGGPGLHLGDLGPHERNLRRRGNRSFSIDIPEFHMELNREDMRELRRSMRELQEQLHEMLQDLHIEFEGEGRRWQERNDRQRARERLRRQLLQERDGDGL